MSQGQRKRVKTNTNHWKTRSKNDEISASRIFSRGYKDSKEKLNNNGTIQDKSNNVGQTEDKESI